MIGARGVAFSAEGDLADLLIGADGIAEAVIRIGPVAGTPAGL
ncbi:hypothetical protein A7982_12910 [Minicystis rosea]|nr:hypothetical protein A7982_12910 [Minicystis rosea]